MRQPGPAQPGPDRHLPRVSREGDPGTSCSWQLGSWAGQLDYSAGCDGMRIIAMPRNNFGCSAQQPAAPGPAWTRGAVLGNQALVLTL